jgi:hypothetical protein
MKACLRIISICSFSFAFSACQKSPDNDNTLFTRLEQDDTHIDFVNTLEETIDLNIFTYDYLYNGAGVAAGDVNNDGLVDLYFVGNTATNRLYLNKGNFAFQDITEMSGTGGKKGWKTGVSLQDVDGDGKLDLYVCHAGLGDANERTNELYINNGNNEDGIPTFSERAQEYGLDAPGTYTTQASFLDYDLDGDLDVFLLNHGIDYHSSFTRAMQNRNVRHAEYGNRLYRNDHNKFIEVSTSISDFNADGYPDLYVSNDFDERDFLYINNKNGTFTESLKESFGHISKYTMGSDAADINNDLWPDLITMDMLPSDNHRKKLLKGPDNYDQYSFFVNRGYHHQQMRNMLQIHRGLDNAGHPIFSEVGQLAGISSTDWSWASLFADFDNDGQKDLFVTNGYLRDLTNMDFQKYDFEMARQQAQDQGKNPASKEGKEFMFQWINKMPSIRVSNYIFRNTNGLQFENKTEAWGMYEPRVTTGAVYADLDNDGDLDIVTSNINEKAGIYRNNATAQLPQNHFVRMKLQGAPGNPFGIGSKVFVTTASGTQMAEAFTVRGYLSTVDHVIHFGLGRDSVIAKIEVKWPNGSVSVLNNVQADTTLALKQTSATTPLPVEDSQSALVFFSDASDQVNVDFVHRENSYIDFKYERLVLSKLSTQGPKVAVGDVNRDGDDDFFIGGAIGQGGRLYVHKGDGFVLATSQPWDEDKQSEDAGVLFFDAEHDGDLDLYVVSGGCEQPEGSPELNDRLYLNDGKGGFKKITAALPEKKGSAACVASADFDRDGDFDLFVGGWSVHAAYPNATPSRLLRNDSDRKGVVKFTDVTASVCPDLMKGLTTDATWFDADGDGWQELVVVGQWMPIQIYHNDKGTLKRSADAALEKTDGFWNTVAQGDFDGDGDLDLLAGNLGVNGEFKAGPDAPLQLYYDDYDKNGQVDPICTYYENGKVYPVPTRDDLIGQIPYLKKKFLRYEQFADATIEDVLTSEQLSASKKLSVYQLSSIVLTNEGAGKFTLSSLPLEVQYSPVQAMVIEDFNHDGADEVLTSGNLFSYRVEYGPFDASLGTLLTYSKHGFQPMPTAVLGNALRGDSRDMKVLHVQGAPAYVIICHNDSAPAFLRVAANTPTSVKQAEATNKHK